MPGASEDIIDKLEKSLAQLPSISSLISEGLNPEEILQRLFPEERISILENMPIKFRCKCSRERVLSAIKGLGEDEITSMIKEDQGAETRSEERRVGKEVRRA